MDTTAPPPTPVDQALAWLLEDLPMPQTTEDVPLEEAVNRVLAQPIVAMAPIPAADNSAVDGYAVRAGDVASGAVAVLPISQRITAGRAPEPLAPGTAARIFTGALVPPGADAVVMQEKCNAARGEVRFQEPPQPGSNIRRQGEDVPADRVVLARGARLRPQDLAMAASVGCATLPVYTRPRVAVLASGNELTGPGEPLGPGEIYDSNRYALIGLLKRLGAAVVDAGRVADSPTEIRNALLAATGAADLVLTSGGVSVGEEDHVRPLLAELGRIVAWRVAVRPGKPVAFGRIGQVPVLSLPGNPVALLVNLLILGRPAVLKLAGAAHYGPTAYPVRATFGTGTANHYQEYLRVRLEHAADGLTARLYPNQGSGVMSSAVWADGLAVVPAGRPVQCGDRIDFLSFAELLA